MQLKNVKSLVVNSLVIVTLLVGSNKAQTNLTECVNPFVGTSGHGHTYPGAVLPFGLVQLSPDTDITGWDWCSGYHYSDSSIMGFSHTHLSGTGCADYGDILIMPTTGNLLTNPGTKENPDLGYRSRFDHKNEKAKPGYYSVILDDYNIDVELTVTKRAGFHKYTFPKSDQANIIIDLVHGIEDKTTDAKIDIIDNNTISGHRRSTGWANNHCVYFYAEFSKAFNSYGIINGDKSLPNEKSLSGDKIKSYVSFSTEEGESVLIKVGISHTSIENAKNNLLTEIPHWNFEQIKSVADSEWEKELSKIIIESNNNDEKNVFYTALYHSLLNPNTFSDVSGDYTGMDNKIYNIKNGNVYTAFSLWDTFRGLHPLLTIIDKDKANDMVRTLISKYEEQGLLPVWELAANETGTMIGYHAIPVIYDAFSKGIRDYDVEKAFEAMKKSAMQNHHGLEYYKDMGFISSDLENESVSKTLEYAYDDWCIAMMAKELGKEEDYKYFIDRAQYYKNVFDPSTNLMRPKKNGKWFEPFDPYSVSGNYTEANAWQYSFFVPQDINGLINLMGGTKIFLSKLDELFTTNPELTGRYQPDITGVIGQYAHGNEPSHHMAYLYNYAGEPQKTQEKIHEIIKTLYSNKPDGLSGNEDCGQMSAWYVLSSAGFYPVCPGDRNYIIGTPNFGKVFINTSGKQFTVIANNLSDENYYIQSVKLNGKQYPSSYIKYEDIEKGGELVFEMGNKPSEWGKAPETRPTSSIDHQFVIVPYLISGERVFHGVTKIEIASIDDESKIYFTSDGSDPRKSKIEYSQPIELDETTTIKFVCEKNGVFSKVVTSIYTKISEGRSIKLNTKYHHSYTGGGELGLIDGIKGSTNFRTDAWQGYEGENLEAIIDLGEIQEISTINVSFLQETKSWIFFPKEIEYFISKDGIEYEKVYSVTNSSKKEDIVEGIKDFKIEFEANKIKFVKVMAKNLGVCPDWHLASGGKSWLFVDEILLK
ncbi:MAG: GH92 family glycosyl hydrolase [Bacteroidetes bacterium]|nr:GH92 family glycosyl hydrolase [Bacteroidota bacterium]MBU1800015.1 GH92 family glycosyl hydrolase [Bacteroidota bacterium]